MVFSSVYKMTWTREGAKTLTSGNYAEAAHVYLFVSISTPVMARYGYIVQL